MSNGDPKLSVTVLNYNYGHFLPACLDAILAQTFTDFELIIIDDCSTDGSLDVIRPYLADPRVRLVAHDPNRGYLASLIEGTEEHSRGEYVTVISADDLVRRPDAFERQIALLESDPRTTFCFSAFDCMLIGKTEHTQTQRSYPEDRVIESAEALRDVIADNDVMVLHSGTIIRKSAYERIGGYRRDLKFAPDFAMWAALTLAGPVAYSAQPLYAYRIHGAQMSGSMRSHRQLVLEAFAVIKQTCEQAKAQDIALGSLRRDAEQCQMFGAAVDEVFRGARTVALKRCAVAMTLRPLDTLRSRYLWIVLARATLGSAGFGALRASVRTLTNRVRRRPATARPA